MSQFHLSLTNSLLHGDLWVITADYALTHFDANCTMNSVFKVIDDGGFTWVVAIPPRYRMYRQFHIHQILYYLEDEKNVWT